MSHLHLRAVQVLRAAALVLWRRSNLLVKLEIAHLHLRQVQVSGKEQERPRDDI